jgi:hypothetical protein
VFVCIFVSMTERVSQRVCVCVYLDVYDRESKPKGVCLCVSLCL